MKSTIARTVSVSLSWLIVALWATTSAATVQAATARTISSTDDNGPGTLREALQRAQRGDTINFDLAVFPAEAPATIFLTSGLPGLTQGSLTLDGSDAGVILDGSRIGET